MVVSKIVAAYLRFCSVCGEDLLIDTTTSIEQLV